MSAMRDALRRAGLPVDPREAPLHRAVLTRKARCDWCRQPRPYDAYPEPPAWEHHNKLVCTACREAQRRREAA